MASALENHVTLLSLTPEFEYGSFWEEVVLPAFSWVISTVFPLRLVNSPGSSCALAAGAFILMKRAEFEALGGHARLKDTVIEDLRTAQLFERNGRQIHLAITRGLFRTRMYKNLRELWEGLTHTSFEGVGFSVAKVLAGVTVRPLSAALPTLTALLRLFNDWELQASPLHDRILLMAVAASAVSLLVYLPVLAFFRLPARYVFFLPLAALFYCLVALDSMLVSVAGQGVPWKGRCYQPPRA
jgi:chlorobactene glucosyltransferase